MVKQHPSIIIIVESVTVTLGTVLTEVACLLTCQIRWLLAQVSL